jgi:hypothetical protein
MTNKKLIQAMMLVSKQINRTNRTPAANYIIAHPMIAAELKKMQDEHEAELRRKKVERRKRIINELD